MLGGGSQTRRTGLCRYRIGEDGRGTDQTESAAEIFAAQEGKEWVPVAKRVVDKEREGLDSGLEQEASLLRADTEYRQGIQIDAKGLWRTIHCYRRTTSVPSNSEVPPSPNLPSDKPLDDSLPSSGL